MSFWSVVPIIILFVLFFLKVPVAYSMIIAAASYFLLAPGTMDPCSMIQKMISSNSSFTYLAIPFFTCAGVVFGYSGITKRLMGLAEMIVGQMRGGMAQVNVLLSALMGGLSGSANADAALQSKMLVPQMEKLGYNRAFSCAVTAASSCITPIIPPGIILILYATASNVSVAKMFYAGYIPGIVITVTMMVLTWWISKKRNYKPSREKAASGGEFGRAFIDALPALFVPFGLVLGLRFGIFTPTEAGAICVLYAIIIGMFVYKELKPSDIPKIIKESVVNTAGVMFILAGAQAFSIYLTWERLPNMISEAIISGISNPYVFLIVVNILLLIVGMFFDGGAAMILLAPLLVPAAQALGIDLIHFGIVLAVNLTIAGMTPPFGAMMFVSTSITGTRIEDYTREALPYIAQLIICLLLITYIPQIVTFLPNLLAG
ncbi:TRAP transporter large permease [Butyricicoccus faecihominis]|uniref:TRAP transporter large permease n=1 Tax=Butyricicoccaceae TaxID=3085642 RepID=UPI002478B1A1|nr:TRAP transporter large permease [Agathobaculum sp. NTUH-O15-33]MCQ5128437.1 TRAP transporter large permease [Butyricicoccus faecihominis]WNX83268.1 TRAP transporter large permease [Agathobaculum sp. NTUH-O15-33]